MTAEKWAIGVDIGGTKIAAAAVSSQGRTARVHTVATPAAAGAARVLDTVADLVRRAAASIPAADVVGIGVGTGGVVDHASGTVVTATDLIQDWAGCEVASELERRLSLPVAVDNDGNTIALGERWRGAGADLDDVLYVAVGTGIGGAVMLGGRLVRGAHHTAGELGHIPVADGAGAVCSCGHTDHLESVASGPAIEAAYARVSGERPGPDLREIATRADGGDAVAVSVIRSGANSLGRGLAGLVNVVDPQAVILNGGVTGLGDSYVRQVEQALRQHCLPAPGRGVRVLLGHLGPLAGVVGAACLSLEASRTTRPIGAR